MNNEDKIRLLADGVWEGLRVWQALVQIIDSAAWHIQPEDINTLRNGPDDAFYWEAATNAEMDALHTDEHGHAWRLYQYAGDIFAYRADLTIEEFRKAFP